MEKITLGRYAQLTQDLAFKRVFASEEDKDLLVAMLNTFLECKLAHPIKDVDIKNPYIPGQTPTDRDAVLDIHCQDAEGNRFITEMQILPQKHFIQRALFYSGTSIASSGKKGIAWDFNFPNHYSLNFLDFDMDFGPDCNGVVQYISQRNDENLNVRYNYLNLAFVVLPRFIKTVNECQSFGDQLIYSLRHAHEFEEKPAHFKNDLLDRLYTRAEFYQNIKKSPSTNFYQMSVILISNFSRMEYDQYLARFMGKNDRYAQLAYAEEQGEARGEARGITIGEARGVAIGEARGREEGREERTRELFSLWESGVSLTEAKQKFGLL